MSMAPFPVAARRRNLLLNPAARTVVLLTCISLGLLLGDIAAYHWVGHFAPLVRSDGEGYYIYLPAWFVDHDATLVRTVARHFAGLDYSFAGLVRNSHGYTIKYGIGVAVLQAPFFLVAQLFTKITGGAAGGYSFADQCSAVVAAGFWGIAGLAALRAFLRRRFSEPVVLATLAALLLGTDLYHYLTADATFSHAYTFGAVSITLLSLQRWEAGPDKLGRALLLGIAAGIVVLIRPTNAVLLSVIPLYGVGSVGLLRKRVTTLIARWRQVLLFLVAAALTFAPQLLQWHAETGDWIVYSYPGEGFSWLHPHLLAAFFSFDPHGLLPWSPMVACAIVGFVWLRRLLPEMFVATVVAVLLGWYVISAWDNWWYGGGYGDRAFIDIFPLLALPLAALFGSVRRLAWRVILTAVVLVLVGVTSMQMIHYWQGLISIPGMSVDRYFSVLFTR